MKILCKCINSPACFRNCLQGIGKQSLIVRFKLYSSISTENLIIHLHKIRRCQTAFCMAILWPWIRKVQIDLLYLPWFKNFCQLLCIHTHKENIWKLQLCPFLQRPQQYAGIPLDPDKIHLGISGSHFHNKTAFSHAYLNADGIVVAK